MSTVTETKDLRRKPAFAHFSAILRKIDTGALLGGSLAYVGWLTLPYFSTKLGLNQALLLGAAVGLGLQRLIRGLFACYYLRLIEMLIQRRFSLLEEPDYKAYKSQMDRNRFGNAEPSPASLRVVCTDPNITSITPQPEPAKASVKRKRIVTAGSALTAPNQAVE